MAQSRSIVLASTSNYRRALLARLREFYRPYNESLAEYLGMDLDWDEQPAD